MEIYSNANYPRRIYVTSNNRTLLANEQICECWMDSASKTIYLPLVSDAKGRIFTISGNGSQAWTIAESATEPVGTVILVGATKVANFAMTTSIPVYTVLYSNGSYWIELKGVHA